MASNDLNTHMNSDILKPLLKTPLLDHTGRPEYYGDESYKNYPEWMHQFIIKYDGCMSTFIGSWRGTGILVLHDSLLCTPEGETYINGIKVDFNNISTLEKRVQQLEQTLSKYENILSHMLSVSTSC